MDRQVVVIAMDVVHDCYNLMATHNKKNYNIKKTRGAWQDGPRIRKQEPGRDSERGTQRLGGYTGSWARRQVKDLMWRKGPAFRVIEAMKENAKVRRGIGEEILQGLRGEKNGSVILLEDFIQA